MERSSIVHVMTDGSHEARRQIPITGVAQEVIVPAATATLAKGPVHIQGGCAANEVVVVQRHHERYTRLPENVENGRRKLIVEAVSVGQVRLEVLNQPRQALFGVKRINAVKETFRLLGHAEMVHAPLGEAVHEVVCKGGRAVLGVLCGEMSNFMPVLREEITGLKEEGVSASRQPKSLMNLQHTHSIA
jgi:hypothetical protein